MQGRAVFLSVLVITLSLSGCFGEEAAVATPEPEVKEQPVSLSGRYGQSIDIAPLEMTFQFSDVGETGKNPASASPQRLHLLHCHGEGHAFV